MGIQDGWQLFKSLCSHVIIDTNEETGNVVQRHFYFELCILSGQDDTIISCGGSNRGWECELSGQGTPYPTIRTVLHCHL